MNIKKLWKELKIWLGWKRKRIMDVLFTIFLGFGMVCMGWVLYWYPSMKTVSPERFDEIASTIIHPVRAFFVCAPIILLSFILMTVVSVNKKPKNWRLVIEDAKKFKEQCTEEDKRKFEYLISVTKRYKDGRALHFILENPGEL